METLALVPDHVGRGFGPDESEVTITTIDGQTEYLAVSDRSLTKGLLPVAFICTGNNGSVLVGVPGETASGKSRLWVSNDLLTSMDDSD